MTATINYLFSNHSYPAQDPDVSAANGSIVYVGEGDDGIFTIETTDRAGGTPNILYTAPALNIFPASPSYSQDGTKITFSEWDETVDPNFFRIYIMNSDGTGKTTIWSDNSGVFQGPSQFPRFNPAGTKIIFQNTASTGVNSKINTMNIDGTGLTTIVDYSGSDFNVFMPDWAVDNLILFVKQEGSTYSLHTCLNDGTSDTAIVLDYSATTLTQLGCPRRRWGVSGTIYFLATDDDFFYLMSTGGDGTGTAVLISSDGSAPSPDITNGLGVFANSLDFILTVDEFTLALVDDVTLGITFALFNNSNLVDWSKEVGDDETVGFDYLSYFVSGYKLRGEGIRKFQSNWIEIWGNVEVSQSFNFTGLFDYATINTSGRWTNIQRVTLSAGDFSRRAKRLKVRGHGKVLQFRVDSVPSQPFNIEGWSTFDSVNQKP